MSPRKRKQLMPNFNPEQLSCQLATQRRTVDFDTFDIQLHDLLRMLSERQISIAPAYQRKFRWDNVRCSELIESLMLGIPIPNLFMATNDDNTWEAVDGVQRLSAIAKFAGGEEVRTSLDLGRPLVLEGLKKLYFFNGTTFLDFQTSMQRHVRTRPLKVVTLNDKSDKIIRFDLFERLNTGGVLLTNQEIRDCVFQGQFAETLDELAQIDAFQSVVRLPNRRKTDGTLEECVLRFFAFMDRYNEFDHSVEDFLTNYMQIAAQEFDYDVRRREFQNTFLKLAQIFPDGIRRPGRKGMTPLNLYEGVAVGAALALNESHALVVDHLEDWMDSDELRGFTTGATNTRQAVKGRIEFCRDRFKGDAYVHNPEE